MVSQEGRTCQEDRWLSRLIKAGEIDCGCIGA
jgi:hypothetical protein